MSNMSGGQKWYFGKKYEDLMPSGDYNPALIGHKKLGTVPIKGGDMQTYDLKYNSYDRDDLGVLSVAPNLEHCTSAVSEKMFGNIQLMKKFNRFGMQGMPRLADYSGPDWIGMFANSTISRGQTQQADQLKSMWENQHPGHFCNYTFFPAVRFAGHEVEVVPYAIVYSSKKITFLPDDEYIQFNCKSPPATVNVDRSLILDDNCEKAMISALNASAPVDGSCITIVPGFSIAKLEEKAKENKYRATFGVRGASCGLAVQAAILGLPSIMYTGFTGQIDTDKDLVTRAQEEMLRDKYGKTVPQYSQPFTTYAIGRGMGLIENVDHTSFKLAYCMKNDFPIVFPRNSSLQQPLYAFLERMSKTGGSLLAGVHNQIYTAAQVEDGVSIADFKTQLFMATSILDAAVLASIAALAYMAPRIRQVEPLDVYEKGEAVMLQKNEYDFKKRIESRQKSAVAARAKKENPVRFRQDKAVVKKKKLADTNKKQLAKLEKELAKKVARVEKMEKGEKLHRGPTPLQRYIQEAEEKGAIKAKESQQVHQFGRDLGSSRIPDTRFEELLNRARAARAPPASASAIADASQGQQQQQQNSSAATSAASSGGSVKQN